MRRVLAPSFRATLASTESEIKILIDDPEVHAIVQRGGPLKLLTPSQFALKTLKMIGLLKLFEVFEDQEAAVASFQAP